MQRSAFSALSPSSSGAAGSEPSAARLLLDDADRVVAFSDQAAVLEASPLRAGDSLSRRWPGLMERVASGGSSVVAVDEWVPGCVASLSTLGGYRLLELRSALDVLAASLDVIRFSALVFDRGGRLVHQNPAARDFPAQLGFPDWSELLPEELDSALESWIEASEPVEVEQEAGRHFLRWEISPDDSGRFLVLICHLLRARENYRRILEYSVDGIYQTSRTGELIYANRPLARLFGYASPAEMKHSVRKASRDIYRRSADRERFLGLLTRDDEVVGFECELYRRDGESVWVRQNARTVRNEDGEVEYIVGTVADVTELKRAEAARRRAETDYQRLFNSAQAGLYQITQDGRFLKVNEMFARLLGFDTPAACVAYYRDVGQDLYVYPEDRQWVLGQLRRYHRISHARVQFRRRDGKRIWVLLNAQYVEQSGDQPAIIEGSLLDITEQVDAEEQIRYLAEHDALTALPNRSQFKRHLEALYERSDRGETPFAVIFLDLDHFKDINDTLGHLVGDQLLCEVARRLGEPLSEPHRAFRLGGDEFAIIVERHLDETALDRLCTQIGEVVGRECRVQENHLNVSASMGVARSSDVTIHPDVGMLNSIMRAVDIALYSCKRTGRAGYRLYHEGMRLQLDEEKKLERELAEAIARDELQLYFQPVFDSEGRQPVGAEALIRWPTPGGLITPASFIPLAERCGLIADIDIWVIQRVADCCEHIAARHPGFKVSFNLSAHHFNSDTLDQLLEPLGERLRDWGPNMALELTERVLFENNDRVIGFLETLRGHGVTISLDDFGTGYSSLSYLTQFPVDKIKIDQSFVQDMLTNPTAMAVVQAAAQIGGTLKLNVNAEGIESAAQLSHLQSLDIDEVQGFYLAEPMTLDALLAALDAWA